MLLIKIIFPRKLCQVYFTGSILPVLHDSWSGHWRLNRCSLQVFFLVNKVARQTAEFRKKTCRKSDEPSCMVNSHLAQIAMYATNAVMARHRWAESFLD